MDRGRAAGADACHRRTEQGQNQLGRHRQVPPRKDRCARGDGMQTAESAARGRRRCGAAKVGAAGRSREAWLSLPCGRKWTTEIVAHTPTRMLDRLLLLGCRPSDAPRAAPAQASSAARSGRTTFGRTFARIPGPAARSTSWRACTATSATSGRKSPSSCTGALRTASRTTGEDRAAAGNALSFLRCRCRARAEPLCRLTSERSPTSAAVVARRGARGRAGGRGRKEGGRQP
eukprot:364546-Chlamydomonas_euryale.AAC.9